MQRTGLVLALCLAAVGLLGACTNAPDAGGAPSDAAQPPPAGASAAPATTEQLVGTWIVDASFDTPDQPYLTIRDDGSWSGSDGCNGATGTWEVGGDGTLIVEADPSTLIYCDGKPLPALFANAASASVDTLAGGDTLTLVDDSGTTTTLIAGREDLTPITPPAS